MSACLLLHGIGPLPPHVAEDETPYWISHDAFATVIALLQKFPTRLTFDDGNTTDVTVALPALVKAGLKASFFIPSARINTDGYVSDDDIAALHKAGMEVGSHGCAHLDWTNFSDAEIAHDVMQSVERLSAIIQAPVRSVAIPFGACDRRVLAVLRKLGMGPVYSSYRGPGSASNWLVRRDCITVGMSRETIQQIVSHKPAVTELALNVLRVWRRAGNAALWTA
jgi:peptidoglycan/xylan/chitin deacetylase (PgdA/CDA1 family)